MIGLGELVVLALLLLHHDLPLRHQSLQAAITAIVLFGVVLSLLYIVHLMIIEVLFIPSSLL